MLKKFVTKILQTGAHLEGVRERIARDMADVAQASKDTKIHENTPSDEESTKEITKVLLTMGLLKGAAENLFLAAFSELSFTEQVQLLSSVGSMLTTALKEQTLAIASAKAPSPLIGLASLRKLESQGFCIERDEITGLASCWRPEGLEKEEMESAIFTLSMNRVNTPINNDADTRRLRYLGWPVDYSPAEDAQSAELLVQSKKYRWFLVDAGTNQAKFALLPIEKSKKTEKRQVKRKTGSTENTWEIDTDVKNTFSPSRKDPVVSMAEGKQKLAEKKAAKDQGNVSDSTRPGNAQKRNSKGHFVKMA